MTKAIFTTYYAGKLNPQRTAQESVPNDFSMFEAWYNSVVRLGLHGIIFHDKEACSPEFTAEYECPNVHFELVDYISDRSLNDERYYVYLRDIIQKKGIEWILTTDLFDVDFLQDPFEFMTDKNSIYVGSETEDVANFGAVINPSVLRIYGEKADWLGSMNEHLLNAGIIGGHRDIMLRLLNLMIEDFDQIDPAQDSNMFVLSRCIFGYQIPFVTGYPLHSSYKKFEESGGFYIRHK